MPNSLTTSVRTLLLKLKTALTGKPVWQIKEGVVIEPAFIHRGRQFYCVKDQFNTFTLRGMAAIEVYDKWNMRMDRDTLQKYVTELLGIFKTTGSIDLGNAVTLLNGMQERLNWVIAPQEYLKDLFCVTYFDKSENPYSYDSHYQIEKKKFLFGGGDAIDPFFAYTRLGELTPMPKLSADDLATAFRVIPELEKLHSQILYNGRRQARPKRDSSSVPN